MAKELQAGTSVIADPSHPIIGNGDASSAVLTKPILSSSDSNILSIIPDPNSQDDVIVVANNPGTATITGTCTATELDGTVHTISLTPEDVTVTAAPPPPVPPAVAFSLVFGTPFQTNPPAPTGAPTT